MCQNRLVALRQQFQLALLVRQPLELLGINPVVTRLEVFQLLLERHVAGTELIELRLLRHALSIEHERTLAFDIQVGVFCRDFVPAPVLEFQCHKISAFCFLLSAFPYNST